MAVAVGGGVVAVAVVAMVVWAVLELWLVVGGAWNIEYRSRLYSIVLESCDNDRCG